MVPDVVYLSPAAEETGAILCQLPITSGESREPSIDDQSSTSKTRVVRCRAVTEKDGIPSEDLVFGFDLNERLLALSIHPGCSQHPTTTVTPTTADFASLYRERPGIFSIAPFRRWSEVIDFVQQTWRLVERRTGVLEKYSDLSVGSIETSPFELVNDRRAALSQITPLQGELVAPLEATASSVIAADDDNPLPADTTRDVLYGTHVVPSTNPWDSEAVRPTETRPIGEDSVGAFDAIPAEIAKRDVAKTRAEDVLMFLSTTEQEDSSTSANGCITPQLPFLPKADFSLDIVKHLPGVHQTTPENTASDTASDVIFLGSSVGELVSAGPSVTDIGVIPSSDQIPGFAESLPSLRCP